MHNALRRCALIVACTLMTTLTAHAQTLRIGLAEDPDVLDPTLARTLRRPHRVRGAVRQAVRHRREAQHRAAARRPAYEWSADSKALTIKLRPDVTFHDGEKLDAAAVKYSLERHKTMAGSNRRGELAPVASVDVVDPTTVRLNLSAPFAPLLAQLADRAGMIVSPKAAQAAGDKFGTKPVCAGPFKFVERVAQDRIVLERFANYWNKADDPFRPRRLPADPRFDGAPREPALGPARLHRAPRRIRRAAGQERRALQDLTKITEIGYQGITINVGKSDLAQKNPLGTRSARARGVRAGARPRRHRAGRDGRRRRRRATSGSRRRTRSTRRTCRSRSATSRARRRCCRKPACRTRSFTLMTPTTSDAQRIAQVVQAMATRSRLRREDPVDRVRDVARPGRQGPVRRVRARVERPRRPRRQHLQLRRLQAAAQLRGLLQAGGRRDPQPVAHDARPGGAHEALRAARGDRAQGPADRLPVSPPLAVGVHEQARRLAHRFPTASCACRACASNSVARAATHAGRSAPPCRRSSSAASRRSFRRWSSSRC